MLAAKHSAIIAQRHKAGFVEVKSGMVDVERLAARIEIHQPKYNAPNDGCDDAGTTSDDARLNRYPRVLVTY
jgi:hypothetical protein